MTGKVSQETNPSRQLEKLGMSLPAVVAPLAAYTPAIVVGDQVWTSGQLPMVEGSLPKRGKLGAEVSLAEGRQLARIAAINALAAAASMVGGIDGIRRILKVVVYVASDPSFTAQPQVANGASEVFGEVFGDHGVHVRSAVGVAVLPLDSPVELELIAQVNPDAV